MTKKSSRVEREHKARQEVKRKEEKKEERKEATPKNVRLGNSPGTEVS